MAANKNKIPIQRNNKFFDEGDFDLDKEMGREHIEEDLNFTVVLYKVDRQRTQSDDIYKESVKDGIKFHTPVELRVVPTLETPENKAYNDNGTARFLEDGKLVFGLYQDQLEEKETEINYGDYIGYAVKEDEVRYYSVVNDGIKNYDNEHTIMGYKGAFRTIECAPVDENEFESR